MFQVCSIVEQGVNNSPNIAIRGTPVKVNGTEDYQISDNLELFAKDQKLSATAVSNVKN